MSVRLICQHLCKEYRHGENHTLAVSDICTQFEDNTYYAVLGHSGCGKSTLLRMLGGLEKPTSGKVIYQHTDMYSMNDVDLSNLRNHEIGFVFQSYQLIPELTVLDNISLPCWLNRKEKLRDIKELAKELGISNKLKSYPDELSGGQQQRVALARAFINKPRLILADEPTGNLDKQNSALVMDILRDYCVSKSGTVIMVSHDDTVLKYVNKVLHMSEGVLST